MAKQDDTNIDAVYYRDGASTKTAMGVLMKARMAMFDLFMSRMQPGAGSTILDVGVSDAENDGANFLEKFYPHPQNITCAGLGDGKELMARYPQVAFRQIEPGAPLPFADQSFDIVCSNAVLEHVGGPSQRDVFLKEHLRVGKSVFLTVPNRWFPVEHHTGLPLLHYLPGLFRRVVSGTKYAYWADPVNMDFIDVATLRREWPLAEAPQIVMTGIPLGPFSSNIALIFRR